MGRVGVIGLLLLAVGISWWKLATALPSERTTVVEDGNPIRVLSWDSARARLTIVPIPEDVYVEGAQGVGTLPLASLRKLESLDESKNGLLVRSLSDTLAVPIIGEVSRIPLPLRLRFWWITRSIRPDAIETPDLDTIGVLRKDTLPDGTTIRVFDTNKFDSIIVSDLEVDSIRREERRVRVVNTTDVPGLGSRVARFLSRAGMVVVAVDGESQRQETCSVHVNEDLWSTATARFVQDVFGCSLSAEDTDEQFDMTVRIGAAGLVGR